MTAPRTQEHRHWIQIELVPNGSVTGAVMVDLNMVDQFIFNRAPQPNNPNYVDQVTVTYAGVMKPLGFKGDNANWLYEAWLAFIDLKAEAPKAAPGLIVMPDATGRTARL